MNTKSKQFDLHDFIADHLDFEKLVPIDDAPIKYIIKERHLRSRDALAAIALRFREACGPGVLVLDRSPLPMGGLYHALNGFPSGELVPVKYAPAENLEECLSDLEDGAGDVSALRHHVEERDDDTHFTVLLVGLDGLAPPEEEQDSFPSTAVYETLALPEHVSADGSI